MRRVYPGTKVQSRGHEVRRRYGRGGRTEHSIINRTFWVEVWESVRSSEK